jgi:hypothetical protein
MPECIEALEDAIIDYDLGIAHKLAWSHTAVKSSK